MFGFNKAVLGLYVWMCQWRGGTWMQDVAEDDTDSWKFWGSCLPWISTITGATLIAVAIAGFLIGLSEFGFPFQVVGTAFLTVWVCPVWVFWVLEIWCTEVHQITSCGRLKALYPPTEMVFDVSRKKPFPDCIELYLEDDCAGLKGLAKWMLCGVVLFMPIWLAMLIWA